MRSPPPDPALVFTSSSPPTAAATPTSAPAHLARPALRRAATGRIRSGACRGADAVGGGRSQQGSGGVGGAAEVEGRVGGLRRGAWPLPALETPWKHGRRAVGTGVLLTWLRGGRCQEVGLENRSLVLWLVPKCARSDRPVVAGGGLRCCSSSAQPRAGCSRRCAVSL